MTVTEYRQLKLLLDRGGHEGTPDAEALSCFRMATRIINRAGYTWSSALEKRVVVIDEVEPAPPDMVYHAR